MIHLIYITLILNAGVFGFCLASGHFENVPIRGIILYSIFLSIFGGLATVLSAIQMFILFICKKINEYFQISTFYKFRFTKELDGLTVNQLERMNRIAVNQHNSNTLRDKIWNYTMKLVNKRNNYTTNTK